MKLFPLIASLALALGVIDLVRRRRLREEFSWLWITGAAAALVLSLWEGARAALGRVVGSDPEGGAVVAGLLFLVLVCLDLSTKVSRLANQNKTLAQELARASKRLSDLERADDDG